MKKTRKFANDYYFNFSKLKGNERIAGLYGLEKILDLVKSEKPKNILEVGLGIGSICYSVLKYCDEIKLKVNYFGTENNQFCLTELPKNLENNFKKMKIFKSIDDLPKEKFEFIIIDGSDNSLHALKKLVGNRALVFIEGGRVSQVNLIKEIFPKHKYTSVISPYKNPEYGPFVKEKWSGGGQIIFTNPSFKQSIHFYKLRFMTFFTYKFLRKLK